MSAIQYIQHKNIDRDKWDETISVSPNGFLYSQSFFLDAMCEWDALIMGDYEYIMPLPYRKKAGFTYIYTPFFTGQLGITGEQEITEKITLQFIAAIPVKFSLVDLQLNESNHIPVSTKINITDRLNYVISLDKEFELIANDFNKDAKKNIRQATAFNLSVTDIIRPEIVFDLYKEAYAHLNKNITAQDYDNFLKACKRAIELQKGFVIGIKDGEEQTVAAAFFGIDNKRIYYLLGAPSAKGKKMNATHFLINEVIKKYAASKLVFDFEGSDIPSVANFYKKFGPQKKSYQHIVMNRLPFWIKWLKGK